MIVRQPQGFIALMSAIIISAILLVAIISGSLTQFYSRFNVLDQEFKERSSSLADACAQSLLLQLTYSTSYNGGTITVGSDTCTILAPVNPLGNPRTFPIQAVYHNTYTDLLVTVDVSTLVVSSWNEVPHL